MLQPTVVRGGIEISGCGTVKRRTIRSAVIRLTEKGRGIGSILPLVFWTFCQRTVHVGREKYCGNAWTEFSPTHHMKKPEQSEQKKSNLFKKLSRLRHPLQMIAIVLAAACLLERPAAAQTLMAFNFNEGQGTNVSSADGKLIGTFVGTPTFTNDTPSALAGDFALQFAAGQRVVVPDPTKVLALDTANPHFTIQAWLKFANPSTRSVFFYNNGPGGAVSASVSTNNRNAFVTTLGVLDQPSTALIPDDNAWHHLAIVHEARKEFRFYIDGTLAQTIPYTRNVIFTRTNQVFYIGAEPTGNLQYVGLLDRLRYSKAMLAPEQLDSKRVPIDARPLGAGYGAPSRGWAYIYNGDKDARGEDETGFTSLDGVWSHSNGSDMWDGSAIGGTLATGAAFGEGNAPGGAMSITEEGLTYLRLQDTGNPASGTYGFPDPYSNRKLYFGRDLTADGAPDALLDEGVTLAFRARVPTPAKTTGPLDQIHADGQSAAGPRPYPAGGDGYLISDGGKGNVGIKGLNGGIISFALTVTNDTFGGDPAATKANFQGLTMNKLNGTAASAAVDFDDPGEFRGVPLDSTAWHEFWITIKADTNGVGTHEVSVYMDGSAQATTNVIVTAGNGNDYPAISFLAMGGSRTGESFALDIDFLAYAVGAEAPAPASESIMITSIVRQGNQVVITWTGGGVLQSTADLAPPATWTDIAGSTSPATVQIPDPKRFYRVKK
jgi:hypothetical protein